MIYPSHLFLLNTFHSVNKFFCNINTTTEYSFITYAYILSLTRADSFAFSILETEYEKGLYDEWSGSSFVCNFKASTYETQSGNKISLSQLVKDEETLFEMLKKSLSEKYGSEDLVSVTDCAWSADALGIRFFFNTDEETREKRKKLNQYTNEAGIDFKLLHTELAVTGDRSFRDYHVHRVLKKYRTNLRGSTGREWFKIDLDTAIEAIAKVKQKLSASEKIPDEINFRPEQEEAIALTVKYFKKGNEFLWNAKMRFGKTLCALEVVKRMNFAKTIIITHRPVVNDGWFDDFQKIFGGNENFIYGSKFKGKPLKNLLASKKNFVYFASIQDLRGSQTVNDKSKVDKNHEVFSKDWNWDFVIVDEAHEGTTTELGKNVKKALVKDNTKVLELSGTPFNILGNYDADNVYTWDYVSEQRAKADWDKNNFGDSNPYADLPQMNIYTYDLGKVFDYVDAEDKSFGFHEFFRTWQGRFVHERNVKKFLDMLGTESDNNYPFSRPDFRELFKHTLWIVPGVKEGRALSALLKSHKVFGENNGFKIVNVAGKGDSDDEPADALEKVRDAIDNNEYTITLSCGKLTTGVTVPEWTAVLYLAGGYSTSPASYLQTIFRVQSPCKFGGKVKTNCFVFDFAPDRTLKMVAEAVAVSARAGQTTDNDRFALDAFIKFCPVCTQCTTYRGSAPLPSPA